MRKRKRGRKFKREKDQRKALLKSLASSLILKEKIRITEAKAKGLSSYIEKKITRARVGDLSSQRLLAKIFSPKVLRKLIKEIGPRYKTRPGGYTRIIKLKPRSEDGARVAIIELVK